MKSSLTRRVRLRQASVHEKIEGAGADHGFHMLFLDGA
jgi:hypothetical protein